MNKEEEYASDSDQSDEDFCPDKEIHSEPVSEEESDDPISDADDEQVLNKKTKARKKTNKKSKVKAKTPESPPKQERVVETRNRVDTETKATIEKDELESDEEDPSKKDALWAEFLSDVSLPTSSNKSKAETVKKTSPMKESKSEVKEEPQKVVISEIFDFAGEEVRVEKTVTIDSIKENGSRKGAAAGPAKRPAGGGGLGSILGQIGKKKKISVLEKTKLDWDSFKSTEGIDEEIRTFNKGKDGYLQRQDFLERTDLRQFEIEKGMRQARRKPM